MKFPKNSITSINPTSVLVLTQLILNDLEYNLIHDGNCTGYAIVLSSGSKSLFRVGSQVKTSIGVFNVALRYENNQLEVNYHDIGIDFRYSSNDFDKVSFPIEMENQIKRIIKQYFLYSSDALELHKV